MFLQIFSTATAFYIPLLCIIVVYWKIMRAARKRFKRERDRRTVHRAPLNDAAKKVERSEIILEFRDQRSIHSSEITI